MKTAAAITALNNDEWVDAQLTMDCGRIPYILYKNHQMDVRMVGMAADMSMYPSMHYIEGVKPVHIPDISIEKKVDYLMEHGREIDLLILHGVYETNWAMAIMYKQVNPNGLILVNSDISGQWMSRLNMGDDLFKEFMRVSDVMFAPSFIMAQYASQKWNREVIYKPNGYFDFTGCHSPISFPDKENIILTVARLGLEVKRTDLLMESFAMIADFVPDWKLRLVGSVEESFKPYIDQFFETHPDLSERICFVGKILDKEELTREYERAKIFALCSSSEGGTNVGGEALTAGCVMAVTRFDVWNDLIDGGRCGGVSEIGDVSGFAGLLRNLCLSEDLEAMSEHARVYASEVFDEEKNVRMLYDRLVQVEESRGNCLQETN